MCAARSAHLTALRSPNLRYKQLAQISRWNEAIYRGLMPRYFTEQFYELLFDIFVVIFFILFNRIDVVEQLLDLHLRYFHAQILDTGDELLQI
jgi:hypothetical protein